MNPSIFRTGLVLLVSCWLASWLPSTHADSLSEAEVPVAGQDARTRSVAAAAALAEVFVKTSGSRRVLDNPAVAGAIREADRLLLQFYFTRLVYPPRDDGPAEELGLHAVFSPQTITTVLRRAGEPLLPPNRPPVLLWLAVDDGSGTGARLFDRDTDAALAAWLRWHAARRGMVLRFPEMDMQDSTTVDAGQVWTLDMQNLRMASTRYGAGPMLLARLSADAGGHWLGQWRYLDGEQEIDGQGETGAMDALAGEIVDFIAETVAARYAVHTVEADGERLRLQVDGLRSFDDYYRTYRVLRDMKSVRRLQLALVDRGTFFFDLTTASDTETVLRELSLLPQLQSLGDSSELLYRWAGD